MNSRQQTFLENHPRFLERPGVWWIPQITIDEFTPDEIVQAWEDVCEDLYSFDSREEVRIAFANRMIDCATCRNSTNMQTIYMLQGVVGSHDKRVAHELEMRNASFDSVAQAWLSAKEEEENILPEMIFDRHVIADAAMRLTDELYRRGQDQYYNKTDGCIFTAPDEAVAMAERCSRAMKAYDSAETGKCAAAYAAFREEFDASSAIAERYASRAERRRRAEQNAERLRRISKRKKSAILVKLVN
jgi:hypothetical protein